MKAFFLILFIIVSYQSSAQIGYFDKVYGVNNNERVFGNSFTYKGLEFDSFFILAHVVFYYNHTRITNYKLINKIDGTIIYEKIFGDSITQYQTTQMINMEKTKDNNIICSGITYKIQGVDTLYYIFLYKLNSRGEIIWSKKFDRKYTNSFEIRDLIVTSDGGTIICCSLYNYDFITHNESQYDFWIIKTDSLGEIEWEKRIGDPYVNDYEVKIAETDDGYFLTGYKKVVGKDMLYGYLQKIDFKGNLLWQKPYEQNKFFNALLGIKRSFDGNFYLWGGTRESAQCGNEDCSRARIIKIDNKGNTIFDRKYFVGYSPTGIAYNEFSDLEELPTGELIVCGGSSETMYNNDGGLIMKLNNKGDSLWSRIYDRNAINGIDDLYGVTICKDGGFLFTGNTLDTTGFSIGIWPVSKAWLMKTDSFGCLEPGCDLGTPIHEIIFTDYGIKLFPNPSSTLIKINITIPQYDPLIKTEVVLVDVSGAIVMRYMMPDFAYIAELDISKLPSGVYGVQLRQPQKSGTRVLATEKLVVID